MKRPLGVTITAAWLGFLMSLLAGMAIVTSQWQAAPVIATAAIPVVAMAVGLWNGRRWAARAITVLLLLAAIVSLARVLVPGPRSPIWWGARAVVMGAWSAYFMRSRTRDFFAPAAPGEFDDEAPEGTSTPEHERA